MDPPFFIICSGRSGSTLLAGMLNMHPAIHVPVELGGLYSTLPNRLKYYGDLTGPFNRRLLANDLAHTGHLGELQQRFPIERFADDLAHRGTDLSAVVQTFYEALRENAGKRFIGDKTPDHMPDFDRIVHLFPEACIVHLVRDGRDCAVSSMAWRRGINFRNIQELASGWVRHNSAVAAYGETHPDRYLRIHYEDLVDETEATLRRLAVFLGVDYKPVMLDHHAGQFARENASQLSHHANLTREVIRGNHGKWMTAMPPAYVDIYESLAGDTLRALGYTVQGRRLGARERGLRAGWRLATQCRSTARRLRRYRNEYRFRIAVRIKRRLRILSLRQALPKRIAGQHGSG